MYAGAMTIIVALLLALAATGLEEKQTYNVALSNKKDILKAVKLDTVLDIEETFKSTIEQVVVNTSGEVMAGEKSALDIDVKKESKKQEQERRLPLYIYTNGEGVKSYILPVRGFGLWDEIWGYVAIEEDFNTIAGVAFDHKAETPGLGAEIKDNKAWGEQFVGKKIMEEGTYVSVSVVKGPANTEHKVSGISGATMTSVGVSDMLYSDIEDYLAYFEKIK